MREIAISSKLIEKDKQKPNAGKLKDPRNGFQIAGQLHKAFYFAKDNHPDHFQEHPGPSKLLLDHLQVVLVFKELILMTKLNAEENNTAHIANLHRRNITPKALIEAYTSIAEIYFQQKSH